MGKRQDGRIEPGQKLSGAISARAWNRAQDAADIVLSERSRFGVGAAKGFPGSLIVSVQLSPPFGERNQVLPGMIVRFLSASAQSLPVTSNSNSTPSFSHVNGGLFPALPYIDRRRAASTGFGVIVGGVTMPRNNDIGFVNVCISGMCVAIVDAPPNFETPDPNEQVLRVRPPVIDQGAEMNEQELNEKDLLGISQVDDCGRADLITFFAESPFPEGRRNIRYGIINLR